jgi:hypothetical protein
MSSCWMPRSTGQPGMHVWGQLFHLPMAAMTWPPEPLHHHTAAPS